MTEHECRACGGQPGYVVLDLGEQPACDHFPKYDDPGPDPVYRLRMWLCSGCGLAQLMEDPTVPEEPRGAEPAALVEQARDAVRRVGAAGLLPPGARVAEYGSPHGGSWLPILAERGLTPVTSGAADVILDCFGMMHAADQAAAMAERAARLAPGGVLLLQYHSLHTIVTQGQWNALRHGHYAYYSATALSRMLAAAGLAPVTSWRFALYGGTVLLAARRDQDARTGPSGPSNHSGSGKHSGSGGPDGPGEHSGPGGDSGPGKHSEPDETIAALLTEEEHAGITGPAGPAVVAGLQRDASARADALREWLTSMRAAGQRVLGYSAASRAVALLRKAGVDSDLLPAVADASPAKHGLRMPGTAIRVISPAELAERSPDAVVLFVPDLMPEVRKAYPEIEAAGAKWLDADSLV